MTGFTLPYEAISRSDAFLEFMERVSAAAAVDRPVLIVGERGAGKELAASRLHYLSPRWQAALVTLNCSAVAPSLVESELFGHERGAFTGAIAKRAGRFEAADGGTLFLDEIGAMPMPVQEKILRVVEYGEFERIGSSEAVRMDVRIIGATNADLPAMAAQGTFKPDLLDRLSFEALTAPPLRHRGEDVLLLAEHFADRLSVELGRAEAPQFGPQAERALLEHSWPGNVRELKNVVERAVYRCKGDEVNDLIFDPFASPYTSTRHAPQPVTEAPTSKPLAAENPDAVAKQHPTLPVSLTDEVEQLERGYLQAAMEQSRFNQRKAADLLGLTYHQFRRRYRKYVEDSA